MSTMCRSVPALPRAINHPPSRPSRPRGQPNPLSASRAPRLAMTTVQHTATLDVAGNNPRFTAAHAADALLPGVYLVLFYTGPGMFKTFLTTASCCLAEQTCDLAVEFDRDSCAEAIFCLSYELLGPLPAGGGGRCDGIWLEGRRAGCVSGDVSWGKIALERSAGSEPVIGAGWQTCRPRHSGRRHRCSLTQETPTVQIIGHHYERGEPSDSCSTQRARWCVSQGILLWHKIKRRSSPWPVEFDRARNAARAPLRTDQGA
jgi:hypothetical protein